MFRDSVTSDKNSISSKDRHNLVDDSGSSSIHTSEGKLKGKVEVEVDDNDNNIPRTTFGHHGRRVPVPKSKRILRMMSQVYLPRLITRDYPYNQSSNRVEIVNENTNPLWGLLIKDWFHVLLRLPSWISLPAFIIIWYISIWVWAAIYQYISNKSSNFEKDCGLGSPNVTLSIMTAYAFSLETCTTVGYGLPGESNAFFQEDCPEIQIAITFQMVWSMITNAFLVSFFFSLLSKSETRSIQLIFSSKLCINLIDGKVCTNVRCYDLDSSFPLVECHARMYLIDHKMKFHPLRLLEPDDDLGGVLYPSAPTSIIHHIDHHSALSPGSMPLTEGDHGLVLRSIDSATASREEIVCPVCGEAYGTYARLVKHIKYARICEEKEDYPIETSHLGFTMPDTSVITLEEVQRHIERKLSEIIVVVEAIDPQLSGTFQSVQSYKYDDIEFGADFERCLSARNNKFIVDLQKFHGVVYDDDMYSKSENNWTRRMSANRLDVNDTRSSDNTETANKTAGYSLELYNVLQESTKEKGMLELCSL